MCGGTSLALGKMRELGGLSPRVRGNPYSPTKRRIVMRSIPACAGEPRLSDDDYQLGWVYPRVCGGTFDKPIVTRYYIGLSPRVRGNPYPRPRL